MHKSTAPPTSVKRSALCARSTVIAARHEIVRRDSVESKYFPFAQPFTIGLWVCGEQRLSTSSLICWRVLSTTCTFGPRVHSQVAIVAMIVLSGVVDYILERKTYPGVYLSACIYEYVAGTLWGGFDYPRTRTSGVYQIITAFIILVVISSCMHASLLS